MAKLYSNFAKTQMSAPVITSRDKMLTYLIQAIEHIDQQLCNNNHKISDLTNLARRLFSNDPENYRNADMSILKSFTIILDDFTVEFNGVLKYNWINVNVHNQGPTWRIDASNWTHIKNALSQTCPSYIVR